VCPAASRAGAKKGESPANTGFFGPFGVLFPAARPGTAAPGHLPAIALLSPLHRNGAEKQYASFTF